MKTVPTAVSGPDLTRDKNKPNASQNASECYSGNEPRTSVSNTGPLTKVMDVHQFLLFTEVLATKIVKFGIALLSSTALFRATFITGHGPI